MSETEKKGITVKIDADLHAQIRQYIEANGMTMTEFVSKALDDELHPKMNIKEEKYMGNMRTMAFQVPEDLFLQIKDYLDTHYTEKITLDALAERFYINKFYLTRVFKEQFGQSVTNYLVQLRITQSKRLLRFTDRSIEAVAQECGLNDANYFSRLFKKVEGTTPGEYRRQW